LSKHKTFFKYVQPIAPLHWRFFVVTMLSQLQSKIQCTSFFSTHFFVESQPRASKLTRKRANRTSPYPAAAAAAAAAAAVSELEQQQQPCQGSQRVSILPLSLASRSISADPIAVGCQLANVKMRIETQNKKMWLNN
jgi:hypothetical protein